MNFSEIYFWNSVFLLIYLPITISINLFFGIGDILGILLIGLLFVGILSIIIYCMNQFEEVPVLEKYSAEENPVSDFFGNEQLLEVPNHEKERTSNSTNPNNFGVEGEPKMRTDVDIRSIDFFNDDTDS